MSRVSFHLGGLQKEVDASATRLDSSNIVDRIWKRDHTVWRTEEVHKKSILNRLGWLKSPDLMMEKLSELEAFGKEIRNAGFTHAVVLGMGGSSLCPDVCRATFGSQRGFPELHVLDSTNPASVERIENAIALRTTLFIVASKSGGTTETNMFYKYFYQQVGEATKGNAGNNFVAITDANTQMEKIALEKKFRKIFLNPEDIGGRYSALSYFGLVPMAVIGMDVRKILESAVSAVRESSIPLMKDNVTAMIGVALGEAFNAGKDKLTWVGSHGIETFGYWTEQLIAESTGKEGKGIVPIEGEKVPDPISGDRVFAFLALREMDGKQKALLERVRRGGHPYFEVILDNAYDLGGEFFRWEFATAVASALMHINPFDEPNVKESKDNTVRVIEAFKSTGALPAEEPFVRSGELSVFCEKKYGAALRSAGEVGTVSDAVRTHLSRVEISEYVALLAYIDQNEKNVRLLQDLRGAVGKRTTTATAVGFGPRYLHSTGQLHKGGKRNAVFLLLTAEESVDRKIPGEPFSFEVLKNAQALGDYQSLASRDVRLIRVHLGKNVESGLKTLRSILS